MTESSVNFSPTPQDTKARSSVAVLEERARTFDQDYSSPLTEKNPYYFVWQAVTTARATMQMNMMRTELSQQSIEHCSEILDAADRLIAGQGVPGDEELLQAEAEKFKGGR